jgi:hypothetical protein
MKKYRILASISFFLLLLPLLSLGQKRGAIVSFTIKGLPEHVRRQMTPQAIDSLHDSLVRQLVQAHRLGSITPLQPEKIRFARKKERVSCQKLKPIERPAGADYDLYYKVYAEVATEIVFAGVQVPKVKVQMAAFDRTGKRVLLTEAMGKDGVAHPENRSNDLAALLPPQRFKKMYFRAVATLRTGGLSAMP